MTSRKHRGKRGRRATAIGAPTPASAAIDLPAATVGSHAPLKANVVDSRAGLREARIREWLSAAGSILGGLSIIVALFALLESQKSHVGFVVATLYQLGQDSNKFFADHPSIRKYFYAEDRPKGMTDEQLLAMLDEECPETRSLVSTAAEIMADFADIAFTQKEFLPSEDWDGWWQYFCDAYDESPVLQRHYENRKLWYQTYSPLKDTSRRKEHYRGNRLNK